MRLFLAGTVCLAAAAAQAQTQTEPEGPTIIGVTDVKVCDTIAAAAPENKLFDAIQSDTMVLLLDGMEAIEYNCVFDGEIQVDPTMTMRQTFPGYCEEPGPYLTPKVFVVDPRPDEGQVHVWQSDSDVPTVFHICM
jgi:hypothetical protein